MRARPIADYLAEFGSNGERGAQHASGALEQDDARLKRESAKVEEAFTRGFESGKAAVEATLQAKLEALRTETAEELACERQAWVTNEAGRLAAALTAGLQQVQATIAESAARVLAPFVTDQVRAKALDELQRSLEALVSKDAGLSVRMSGPSDLLDALRARLDGHSLAVTYQPSDDCDVRVAAGQTLIETRLGLWMAALREALA